MSRLEQALSQPDALLFIGSGLSRWSGLPTWAELIGDLADLLDDFGRDSSLARREIAAGDYLQAASFAVDQLSTEEFGAFIRKAVKLGAAKPHAIHKALIELGPRCFVTTNYDDLLEQALRNWAPDRPFIGPVTNRQPAEVADIIHASSTDFVFKPHGDASDQKSIVLTREQYKALLPDGDRSYALEALRTLMISRPIIYVGFGLKDPDFLFLRDTISNTFKGGTRDHFAIVPDIGTTEIDYWRRNAGLHLVGYKTVSVDGRTEHSGLLDLLRELGAKRPPSHQFDPQSPATLLALARYAASVSQFAPARPELSLFVSGDNGRNHRRRDRFDGSKIEDLLDQTKQRTFVVGLPGAGKTYAVRRSAARKAEALHQACLRDPPPAPKELEVPIVVDLKLYSGSIADQIQQSLPTTLRISEMASVFKLRLYVDSVNEIPREHVENGHFEGDLLPFLDSLPNVVTIFSSRTSETLSKLDFAKYHLDSIARNIVSDELAKLGILVHGRFEVEIIELLRKPFYFELAKRGHIKISGDAHPRDLYDSYIEHIKSAIKAEFEVDVDVESAFSELAFDAISSGEEVFPLARAVSALSAATLSSERSALGTEIANWLLARSILVPYSGHRASFLHQTLTEYFASSELARRLQSGAVRLIDVVSLTRWDQALYLSLGLLPDDVAEQHLSELMTADLDFAFGAVKYCEGDTERIVEKLLQALIARGTSSDDLWRVYWHLQTGVPVTKAHLPALWELLALGDSTGGAAAYRIVELQGRRCLAKLFNALLVHRADYNACANGIGPAIATIITQADLARVKRIVSQAGPIDNETSDALSAGLGCILAALPIAAVRQEFDSPELTPLLDKILCHAIQQSRSPEAFEFAVELLGRGSEKAAFAIYLLGRYPRGESFAWNRMSEPHVFELIRQSERRDKDARWSVGALRILVENRPDLIDTVSRMTEKSTGLHRIVLNYCIAADVGELLRQVAALAASSRPDDSCWDVIQGLDIDLRGQEARIVELLRLEIPKLATALLNQADDYRDYALNGIDLEDLEWWLEWLGQTRDHQLQKYLGKFLALGTSAATRIALLEEFNSVHGNCFDILADHVLTELPDLSFDDISPLAAKKLTDRLGEAGIVNEWEDDLLSRVASESFIEAVLVPLLSDEKSALSQNVRVVLRKAGRRLGRRYL